MEASREADGHWRSVVRSGVRESMWFAGGALLGVVAALLILPESRREMRKQLETWLGDEDMAWLEEIEQEAAATEGGRAGTRDWHQASAS